MKKINISLLTISLLTIGVNVNALDLSSISKSISIHPQVVEKANEITLKSIEVDKILAEDGVKLNFSTKSKLPISYNLDVNKSRADDLDREFIDGVITLSKNLYDFGVVEYKINAQLREKALDLEYLQVFEKILQKLLNTANDVSRIDAVLGNLESNIITVKESIEEIKLRFASGIGTLMEVRQAQLLLLDLETEAQNLHRERDSKLTILRDEFDISGNDLSAISMVTSQFIDDLISSNQDFSALIYEAIEYNRSTEIISKEKSALYSELNSLKSKNMPQINMSATAIIYDVTNGLSEYELYGGAVQINQGNDPDITQLSYTVTPLCQDSCPVS